MPTESDPSQCPLDNGNAQRAAASSTPSRCQMKSKQRSSSNNKENLRPEAESRRRHRSKLLSIEMSMPNTVATSETGRRHALDQRRLGALPQQINCTLGAALIALISGLSLMGAAATTNATSGGHGPLSSSSPAPNRVNSRSPPLTFGPALATIDWPRIGSSLLRALEARVGGGGGGGRIRWRDPLSRGPSSGSGEQERPQSPLRRALARLRSQIGARNTIRVHNAFRDFAWRILAGLSMPTPVIYELRRQNFYSPDEDTANDNFYNRNTSKTIRSRRLLEWPLGASRVNLSERRASVAGAGAGVSVGADSREDDADEEEAPETFRERLRMRLEDLLSLSRRSLFGRVVRLPSLFPFKRHEDVDEENATAQANALQRRPRLLARRRLRRKEAANERQMIQINGKQYYVDEEGELKEWRETQHR